MKFKSVRFAHVAIGYLSAPVSAAVSIPGLRKICIGKALIRH